MNHDIQQGSKSNIMPAVRVAPLGELRLFVISEEELNAAEQGSPASLYLNFALALISSGLSFLTTLLVADISSIRTFAVFVILAVVFLLVGTILFAMWCRSRRGMKSLFQRIRERMPPSPGIPE